MEIVQLWPSRAFPCTLLMSLRLCVSRGSVTTQVVWPPAMNQHQHMLIKPAKSIVQFVCDALMQSVFLYLSSIRPFNLRLAKIPSKAQPNKQTGAQKTTRELCR